MREEIEYTCQCCGDDVNGETHTCPYREELFNSDEECNCCAKCTHECMMDI